MEPVQLAAVLAAVVLLASMLSVELGVTVALVELTLGGASQACSPRGTYPMGRRCAALRVAAVLDETRAHVASKPRT